MPRKSHFLKKGDARSEKARTSPSVPKNMKRTQLQAKWKGQAAKKQRITDASPKRRIPKFAKEELKVFDTSVDFFMDATGEVPATGQLCFVQTGDTLNNRDGAVIHVKSLALRGVARFVPAAAATASTCGYIYVVLDRQANGAAAAVTDVLTSADMSVAHGNVPNQFRFRILKKIPLVFNSQAGVTTAYNNFSHVIDEYIKFPTPVEMRYKASTGAITDLASNNIFLLAGTDAQSDDTIVVHMESRLRFTG